MIEMRQTDERKPQRWLLRAAGEPTRFTRKQIDEAVRKVREEMGLDSKNKKRVGQS